MTIIKQCSVCKLHLTSDQFYKAIGAKYNLSSYCKKCQKEKSKKSYNITKSDDKLWDRRKINCAISNKKFNEKCK